MRLLTTITLLLIVVIPAAADEDAVRPFAYVTHTFTEDVYEDYDIVVIDLDTMETLYSVSTADYDCPDHFSPDYSHLNYSQGKSNPYNHQGFLLEMATGDVHEVPKLSHYGFWSPDSRKLAYRSGEFGGELSLYVYEIEASELNRIAAAHDLPEPFWWDTDLHFMLPFGNHVEIGTWNGDANTKVLAGYSLPDQSKIYLAPDAQIGFIATRVGQDVTDGILWEQMLLDLRERRFMKISLSSQVRSVIWHPDSTQFIYFEDNHNLILYNLSDHASHTLVHTNVRENYLTVPVWSPDGRYLSYAEHQPGGTHAPHRTMNVLEIETGQTIAIAYWVAEYAGIVRWVSDTELVYTYAYSETNPAETTTDLYSFDVTTQERRQLTNTPDLDERLTCAWG